MTAQELQFELMILATFNDFDGQQVVNDLKANTGLWKGAIFTRLDYSELIPLRDIQDNYWNADTLYILTDDAQMDALKNLARGWNADEISYNTDDTKRLGGGDGKVLRVWWD